MYYASGTTGEPFPVIRIAGRFLQKLGFEIGKEIEVEYSSEAITIKNVSNNSADKE